MSRDKFKPAFGGCSSTNSVPLTGAWRANFNFDDLRFPDWKSMFKDMKEGDHVRVTVHVERVDHITAEEFKEVTGLEPLHDDLERVNCFDVGKPGHYQCGWCNECNEPRFVCTHLLITTGAMTRTVPKFPPPTAEEIAKPLSCGTCRHLEPSNWGDARLCTCVESDHCGEIMSKNKYCSLHLFKDLDSVEKFSNTRIVPNTKDTTAKNPDGSKCLHEKPDGECTGSGVGHRKCQFTDKTNCSMREEAE